MAFFRRQRCIVAGLAFAAILPMTGCAGVLSSWIVQTRNHQGMLSLDDQHYVEAAHAFSLALSMDPNNTDAKTGLVTAETNVAQVAYQSSAFKDAQDALKIAAVVDPQNVRVAGLLADVNSARLRQEIVRSNYPAYAATSMAILRGYRALVVENNQVEQQIKRFGYTYDPADLTKAIRISDDVIADATKLTAHVTMLRTLVSAGAISSSNSATTSANGSGSLLPLP